MEFNRDSGGLKGDHPRGQRKRSLFLPGAQKAMSNGALVVLEERTLGAFTSNDPHSTYTSIQLVGQENALHIGLGEAFVYAAGLVLKAPVLSNDAKAVLVADRVGIKRPQHIMRAYDLFLLFHQIGELEERDCDNIRQTLLSAGESLPFQVRNMSYSAGLSHVYPRLVDGTSPALATGPQAELADLSQLRAADACTNVVAIGGCARNNGNQEFKSARPDQCIECSRRGLRAAFLLWADPTKHANHSYSRANNSSGGCEVGVFLDLIFVPGEDSHVDGVVGFDACVGLLEGVGERKRTGPDCENNSNQACALPHDFVHSVGIALEVDLAGHLGQVAIEQRSPLVIGAGAAEAAAGVRSPRPSPAHRTS